MQTGLNVPKDRFSCKRTKLFQGRVLLMNSNVEMAAVLPRIYCAMVLIHVVTDQIAQACQLAPTSQSFLDLYF